MFYMVNMKDGKNDKKKNSDKVAVPMDMLQQMMQQLCLYYFRCLLIALTDADCSTMNVYVGPYIVKHCRKSISE